MPIETNVNDRPLDLDCEVAVVQFNPGEKRTDSAATTELAVAFAGRLDNRKELAHQLGLTVLEASDDRLLIGKAYRRWGRRMPDYLEGGFCLLVWDPSQQCLLGARDPMGEKSFYYFHHGGRFLGTSRLATLVNHPAVPIRLNHAQLALSAIPLAERVIGSQATLYEDVYCLPGGTAFCCDAKGFTSWTYWQPEPQARLNISDAEVPQALRELLFAAVANRLPGTGEPGALLSGGLDSSAIVAVAATILKKQNRSLTTFSAVLPESLRHEIGDERDFIRLFSHHENIRLIDILDELRGPFDNVAALTRNSCSPFHTSRHYLYAAFADTAKRHNVSSLMDGCFGELGPSNYGQGFFPELALRGSWLRLARALQQRAEVRQVSYWQAGKSELLRPLLPAWMMKMMGRSSRFDIEQSAQHNPLRASYVEKYLNGSAADILERVNHELVSGHDHRQIQARGIRLTQARRGDGAVLGADSHLVNCQYPFLDKRVVEFCLAAPGHLKIHRGYPRSLVRHALDGLLPPDIQWRTSKEPFSPDFHIRYNRQRPQVVEWLRSISMNDPVRDIVDVERLLQMAGTDMHGNRGNTPNDFIAMHMVPQGVYLIEFLRTFPEFRA